MAVLYLLIALRPPGFLSLFPSPTAWPSATPTVEVTATPVPTPISFPTPTALHPIPLTPTLEPSFPFAATVKTSPLTRTSDCRTVLTGVVLDREGHGLEGYPVHLWTEHTIRNTEDQIFFSDPFGRWQTVLPPEPHGLWYVQLHAPDARLVYPPLSAIVAFRIPDPCSRILVSFREQ
ncbi:MAG: hypothetical protein RML46_12815 [Anaerolineae bacterium]|nr:hypothetical protein [Anaerolineae bacterium]MDW8069775.1 hypothetical protein [Anaerolineae bacterium]